MAALPLTDAQVQPFGENQQGPQGWDFARFFGFGGTGTSDGRSKSRADYKQEAPSTWPRSLPATQGQRSDTRFRRHPDSDQGFGSYLQRCFLEADQDGWRSPFVLKLCLLTAVVITLLVAALAPNLLRPEAGPGIQLPGRGQPAKPMHHGPWGPKAWFFCAGLDQCDQQSLEAWSFNPKELVVPRDFATIPGIPNEAYAPVAERWRNTPPSFRGALVGLPDLARFVQELLGSDPFGTGDKVPFVNFRPPGEGKVVVISQRQLAFLVANAFMGNTIPAGDGLSAALRRCAPSGGQHGLLYSLLSFLAVLSRELGPGEQGTMLVAATPRARDQSWRQRLAAATLQPPTVCVSQEGAGTDCDLNDFMRGGTPFQALTDIAGGVVGGGAQLCDVANSQDESLVQFYSEVLAFAFFTHGDPASSGSSMLPVPWTLLGARRYMGNIVGQTKPGETCGAILAQDWLNEEIPSDRVVVPVSGADMAVSAGAFVAVASACSGCISGTTCSPGQNMNNECDVQRRHLDDDLELWYQAYEPTMYEASVQEAFRRIVRRVGTGPWGAGDWFGDSQQTFLAVWLATALLGDGTTQLDYYVYDHFCENPGNQCFVLGANGCTDCIARSGQAVVIQQANCGQRSLHDMISRFRGQPVQALYNALNTVGGPPKQVFDLL